MLQHLVQRQHRAEGDAARLEFAAQRVVRLQHHGRAQLRADLGSPIAALLLVQSCQCW